MQFDGGPITVRSSIYYLDRLELYKREKPYLTTFDASALGPSSNHSLVPFDTIIQDAQKSRDQFNLDKHGFQFLKWNVQGLSGFDDGKWVEEKYYPQILEMLKVTRPKAKDMLILKHLRRKRRADFPNTAKEEPVYPNPVVFAHTDFTTDGGRGAVERHTKDRPDLRNRPFELLNVWQVTNGPNRDWPLACCDYTSLDLSDFEQADIIHREYVGESGRLYYNKEQRWYYLDNQENSDVVVFRNADSRGLDVPFSPHVAFYNPLASPSAAPRESIEVRCACFY